MASSRSMIGSAPDPIGPPIRPPDWHIKTAWHTHKLVITRAEQETYNLQNATVVSCFKSRSGPPSLASGSGLLKHPRALPPALYHHLGTGNPQLENNPTVGDPLSLHLLGFKQASRINCFQQRQRVPGNVHQTSSKYNQCATNVVFIIK